MPFHMPTLIVRRQGLQLPAAPTPLPTLRGRVRAEWTDADYVGWDLTGFTLDVFDKPNATAPVKVEVAGGDHPDPATMRWDDLRWVMNWTEYWNAPSLIAPITAIGPRTSAILRLRGGRSFAGVPHNGQDARFIWHTNSPVNPVARAFSDTLDVEWPTLPTMQFRSASGQVLGTLAGASGDAVVINEPTPNDIENDRVANAALGPTRDFGAYFDLAGWPRPAALPGRGRDWTSPTGRVGVIEGTFCILSRVDV
jgi:hypothetical protein